MGTAIQRDRPSEATYRGERFADWPQDLQGNNDLLSLTAAGDHRGDPPRVPRGRRRHRRDQHLQRQRDLAGRLRHVRTSPTSSTSRPPRLARRVADEVTAQTPDKPRYVAGALGPTTRTASISPDVNDPGARNVSFDELVAAYLDAAHGLVDGGADLLVVETIFDTLNAKAAIFALETLFEEHGRRWPVIISGTITDASGRTLSGQVTEAFWASVRHARPLAVGLNCALGATEMRPYIAELSRVADAFVSCYPNAGLPNAFGEYDEQPHETAGVLTGVRRRPASSTWSAAAAAPRPSTSARSRRRWPAYAVARSPRSPTRCGSPVSSRSRSPRTASSSTSGSAPTSPAPRSSAT